MIYDTSKRTAYRPLYYIENPIKRTNCARIFGPYNSSKIDRMNDVKLKKGDKFIHLFESKPVAHIVLNCIYYNKHGVEDASASSAEICDGR